MTKDKKNTYFRDSTLLSTEVAKPSVIKHMVIECSRVAQKKLSHTSLMTFVNELCSEFDLHIVTRSDHQFSPYGSTIVFVLEESHVALHSWPENGYFHCDIVTCTNEYLNTVNLRKFITNYFMPGYTGIIKLKY